MLQETEGFCHDVGGRFDGGGIVGEPIAANQAFEVIGPHGADGPIGIAGGPVVIEEGN